MKRKHELRIPYAYDQDQVSQDNGLECKDESLTVQADAEDADINVLVKRFHLTGTMPQFDRLPVTDDFTGVSNYQDALSQVKEADEKFMELPAEVRARFQHNPHAFLEFCSNPNNREEIQKMGLIKTPEQADAPILVRMEPPPAPKAPEAPKTP
ncbi:MAG: internal scaffolding protein [Microvirus sp.]|nr:MAG: internal scaffolding protein [Microvirus sp.]